MEEFLSCMIVSGRVGIQLIEAVSLSLSLCKAIVVRAL